MVREVRLGCMYSDVYETEGGAVARLILDLPQELIAEIEGRGAKSGTSIPDLIRQKLELRYLHRLPECKSGNISNRPIVRRTIRRQCEMRRRLEDSRYSGSGIVREMRARR